ncbi:heparin lyase I family protein [Kribbella sp. CA-293567]|uniref:heparin lyase I family protein n=1 Tax=Kribbella sp. CA-293567 TaxID=3002436 RepID=UPI0022DE627D|nr:heparin lyase I family protein [Kribbella sp. CA-293567]WBQ08344.1 heparin lyase I family protein [Kribbella sp. CA-293567]
MRRPFWKAAVGTVLTAGLVTTVIAVSGAAQADPAGVFRTLNWENPADLTLPNAAPPGWIKQGGATSTTRPYAITTVAGAPARDGGTVARFELRSTDPLANNGTRTELSQNDNQPRTADRWYGFSINLAADYAPDRSRDIVSQWHDCDNVDQGCDGGSPPLALMTERGNWKIDFLGNILDLGAYQPTQWTDWVFHVKWSTGNDGVLEIWKNGQRMVPAYKGRTFTKGPRSPYFKFGIYKWDWNKNKNTNNPPSDTRKRVLYYDALRLGNENATYADVDPAQGGGTPPPPPPPPPTCTAPAALPIQNVFASTSEAANPPKNVLDGRLLTRWSGQGYGAALYADLGSVRKLCAAQVAWHRGNQRWNDFTVYTSTDNVTYTKAWEGRSSGKTMQLETWKFTGAARDARYVRVSFWQNPENDWASISELKLLG